MKKGSVRDLTLSLAFLLFPLQVFRLNNDAPSAATGGKTCGL